MNWYLVFEIVTALGIVEIIKRFFLFIWKNNIVKRNLEIRKIAEELFPHVVKLKENNFEKPLNKEARGRFYLSLYKIESFDNDLADDLMHLLNLPFFLKILWEDKYPKRHTKLIHKTNLELDKLCKRVIKRLNKLRYKPIIEIHPKIKKFLMQPVF